MRKRIRRARIGIPTNCIFCGRPLRPGATLSGEHLYSKWMKDALPPAAARQRREQVENFKFKQEIGEFDSWLRHGSARGARLHVICAICNNGWMSQKDNGVRPIVTPLIRGENGIYTPNMQEQIAQWLAMKFLVFEAAPKVGQPSAPIFAQSVRDKFLKDKKVPVGFTMWLAPGGGPLWSESAQLQTSGFLASRHPIPRMDLEDFSSAPQNVQTMTWGVGRIVFSIVAVNDPGLVAIEWVSPNGHDQIWPLLGDSIVYPPNFALTDWEITQASLRHHGRPGHAIPVFFRPSNTPPA